VVGSMCDRVVRGVRVQHATHSTAAPAPCACCAKRVLSLTRFPPPPPPARAPPQAPPPAPPAKVHEAKAARAVGHLVHHDLALGGAKLLELCVCACFEGAGGVVGVCRGVLRVVSMQRVRGHAGRHLREQAPTGHSALQHARARNACVPSARECLKLRRTAHTPPLPRACCPLMCAESRNRCGTAAAASPPACARALRHAPTQQRTVHERLVIHGPADAAHERLVLRVCLAALAASHGVCVCSRSGDEQRRTAACMS
jgi:hypothetical protein